MACLWHIYKIRIRKSQNTQHVIYIIRELSIAISNNCLKKMTWPYTHKRNFTATYFSFLISTNNNVCRDFGANQKIKENRISRGGNERNERMVWCGGQRIAFRRCHYRRVCPSWYQVGRRYRRAAALLKKEQGEKSATVPHYQYRLYMRIYMYINGDGGAIT